MPIDTRLSQIQTNKLIASGTTGTATGAKLLIYPHEASDALIPNQGFIDQTVFDTGSIGTDVFLYVSGGIGQKDVGDSQAIAVFGGDVHISGNLSIDGIGSGGENYFWSPSNPFIEASGSLAITGSFRALRLSASNGATITGSLAQGQNVLASGLNAHAQGFAVTASGNFSHAEGSTTLATGLSSHAEGLQTQAIGFYCHAEGESTNAQGFGTHAEGVSSVAAGNYSHAEGQSTNASALASHAEGLSTQAIGNFSHAEGSGSVAIGVASHAEGQRTIASGSYQHVQGKYNLRNNNFSLFVIGDGIGDSDAQRGDIVRVNSGSAIGSGRFEVTGTIAATRGLSGSLTKLIDGTDYLIAGTNITLTTGSNGAITIDSAGGGGGGGGTSFYRLEVLDYASINASTSTVVGQVIFPANQFTGSLVLNGVIGNSDPTATGSLQLYNITSGSYVEIGGPGITHLSVSGTNPTIITSVDLISASNFNSSSQAVYELQVSSSNPSSFATFGGFELRPSGSFTGVTIITSSFFYVSGTWEDSNNRLATTSSVTMAGNLGSGYFADSVGSDVFFFVSGSSGSKDGGTPGVAVFGGDVVISGVLHGGSPLKIGSDVNIFGNLNITQGLSGSLTKLVDGSDYLIAGTNIDLSTGSNGAITISATGGGGGGGDNQRITVATGLTTISTGSVMAGQFYWNTGDWSSSPSTVTLRVIGNTTTTPHTASMRVYNLTANSFINLIGSGQTATQFLNITGSNSTFVTSSNIINNLTNNNLYELRISSSLSSSAVILGNAELYVTF
jgi:hypothetical protein